MFLRNNRIVRIVLSRCLSAKTSQLNSPLSGGPMESKRGAAEEKREAEEVPVDEHTKGGTVVLVTDLVRE